MNRRDEQLRNASEPIFSSPFERQTLSNREQPLNALTPITLTVEGIVICSNYVQDANDSFPIRSSPLLR